MEANAGGKSVGAEGSQDRLWPQWAGQALINPLLLWRNVFQDSFYMLQIKAQRVSFVCFDKCVLIICITAVFRGLRSDWGPVAIGAVQNLSEELTI